MFSGNSQTLISRQCLFLNDSFSINFKYHCKQGMQLIEYLMFSSSSDILLRASGFAVISLVTAVLFQQLFLCDIELN